MGRMPRAIYLWPGLPQIWSRGSWAALGVAVGFAALVDLALVATLVWNEILPAGARTLVWIAVGVGWIAAAAYSRFSPRENSVEFAESATDLYPDALTHYLRGDWFEAETLLTKLLRRNPRDLEARLTLATLLRHTGRHEEAVRQLDRLERFEGAGKWALEIGRERQRLAATAAQDGPPQATQDAAEPPNGD